MPSSIPASPVLLKGAPGPRAIPVAVRPSRPAPAGASHANQALQRLLRLGARPKLEVSHPSDPLELEADRVADQVMRMAEPETGNVPTVTQGGIGLLRSCCSSCEGGGPCSGGAEEETVHRSGDGCPQVDAAGEASIRSLSGGSPLPDAERAFFEPRFGADFSGVRIHADTHAAQVARSVQARAFTLGSDIAFGAGQYAPGTTAGRRLLAHELTHVVQQGTSRPRGMGPRDPPVPAAWDAVAHPAGSTRLLRYSASEHAAFPCLAWSMPRMYAAARLMARGGNFTGRFRASQFMDHFLSGSGSDRYVPFSEVQANTGGAVAIQDVTHAVANRFLERADVLPCGGTVTLAGQRASRPGHFSTGTDLFYAMGGFTISALASGTATKTCTGGTCTIEARMDIQYRIDDLYDWKADPGGCTPATGETGCSANLKTANLPLLGTIADECLNRLVIHGWAGEFMVKARGRASDHVVGGPCGFRNPSSPSSIRNNERGDP